MENKERVIEIDGLKLRIRENCDYRTDYLAVVRNIASGLNPVNVYRSLILNDLFFTLYFIVRPFPPGDEEKVNHPFIVKMCNEIQDGPKDYTLDVWAREHFKTSIMTVAETIQYTLGNPGGATGIFAYARPVAKKFLFTIRDIFRSRGLLKMCFPEIVWKDPEKESPLWSLDEGIILKRSTTRKEPTISAWGLIEGMPTGLHFERRVYDDIITEDVADSPEVMEKIKTKYDSSQNLGTQNGTHRVIGTFYHHADPLTYVRDKKDENGNPKYHLRLVPATEDGTPNGRSIYISQKRLDDLKLTKTFNCQQLCNPTPIGTQKLNPEYLKEIDPAQIPRTSYKFMTIDPAGSTAKGDSWAILVCAVEPKVDEVGASNVYIIDSIISPLGDSEAIEAIVRMYRNAGVIQKVGVEKVGLSSTEIHVGNALRAIGRHISVDDGSLVILRPAGRNKTQRIESALAWPLNNGKLHISKAVPHAYRERLKWEMEKFPFWHDDGLDALSYLYDIIKDFRFQRPLPPLPPQKNLARTYAVNLDFNKRYQRNEVFIPTKPRDGSKLE